MDRFEPPLARPAPRLARADAARARRRAVLDGGDAAALGARRVRAARRPGRVALGVAGRRRRRLPHRPAAGRRARLRLVADRARLSAGDDPLGRHRLHLGRPAPGRRLELARGLSRDGAVHGRRGGVLGAARAAPGRRARKPASVARNDLLGFLAVAAAVARRLRRHAIRVRAAARARSSRRSFAAHGDRARRWPSAGPTWSRSSPASR